MGTPNSTRLANYTVQYDLSGIDDPTVFATEAAPGTTYRLLKLGMPKFYLKVDEGKTTNWLDISSGSTGINLGTGAQVLKNIIANQFQFRTIKGGPGVTVNQLANEIEITFSGADTIDNLSCDPSVVVGDLCVYSGATLVKPASNLNAIIPYGIVGIAYAKPTLTTVNILLTGKVSGLFGLTQGLPLFISSLGDFTHSNPATGNVQMLGFAISTTEIAFRPQQIFRRT
ncbi:MAG: hypothetical protein H7836_04470 [Magnetococcus sp. YQC-3]